jgi:hypothetical protein
MRRRLGRTNGHLNGWNAEADRKINQARAAFLGLGHGDGLARGDLVQAAGIAMAMPTMSSVAAAPRVSRGFPRQTQSTETHRCRTMSATSGEVRQGRRDTSQFYVRLEMPDQEGKMRKRVKQAEMDTRYTFASLRQIRFGFKCDTASLT